MKPIALAVLPLLLVTACGGGDDKAVGVSKAEFLTQSEALCKKANADFEALTLPTTPAGFPDYIGKDRDAG
jgi:hypothetical protein